MKQSKLKLALSQIYLTLVPFLMFTLAIAIGHISYKIYLPIWAIHICIMIACAWTLGAGNFKTSDKEKKRQIIIALFLLTPFALLSILFGIGSPPPDPATYLATANEQQLRYAFLIIGSLSVAGGLSLLRESLKKAGETFYSWLGLVSIMIAAPLFVVYASSDSFLIETLKIRVASASAKMPEWYNPIANHITMIGLVEVALIYLSVAAFATSLKNLSWFKKTSSNIYVIASLIGFILISIGPFSPKPVQIAGFIVGIPAIPFIMPYLIGINLLKRSSNT